MGRDGEGIGTPPELLSLLPQANEVVAEVKRKLEKKEKKRKKREKKRLEALAAAAEEVENSVMEVEVRAGDPGMSPGYFTWDLWDGALWGRGGQEVGQPCVGHSS